MSADWQERVRRLLVRWVDSGLGTGWVVAVSGVGTVWDCSGCCIGSDPS